jgi:hypothetical protein
MAFLKKKTGTRSQGLSQRVGEGKSLHWM